MRALRPRLLVQLLLQAARQPQARRPWGLVPWLRRVRVLAQALVPAVCADQWRTLRQRAPVQEPVLAPPMGAFAPVARG